MRGCGSGRCRLTRDPPGGQPFAEVILSRPMALHTQLTRLSGIPLTNSAPAMFLTLVCLALSGCATSRHSPPGSALAPTQLDWDDLWRDTRRTNELREYLWFVAYGEAGHPYTDEANRAIDAGFAGHPDVRQEDVARSVDAFAAPASLSQISEACQNGDGSIKTLGAKGAGSTSAASVSVRATADCAAIVQRGDSDAMVLSGYRPEADSGDVPFTEIVTRSSSADPVLAFLYRRGRWYAGSSWSASAAR